MVTATGVVPGDAVLDVASGTGKVAATLADRVGPFGRVVALDLSPLMVEQGAAATRDIVQLEFVVGDARELPFEDARFDAATIAFGLASVGELSRPLEEIRRVVRPGGRVVCLERTIPQPRVWGMAYGAAVRRLAPLAGRAVGGGSAYGRIADARTAVPPVAELVEAMESTGFVDVTARRLWLGSVALISGVCPAR
jgi:demethylmenaquinone methyltransferase/2-methoxy-6-polyprenyl-1,4-benzoquinol methylase